MYPNRALKLFRSVFSSILFLWSVTFYGQKPAESAIIVNGLMPAFVIKGEPVRTMNLYERMKFYGPTGISVALIENYQIKWAAGFGHTLSENKDSVEIETLFQAGSISKPVTAVAAFKLLSEGKLSLEKDINTLLKSWKVPENSFTRNQKVTVGRTLTHTAGFNNPGFDSYLPGDTIPNLLQILDGEPPANTPPIRVVHTPGSRDQYSGGGYLVLQQMMTDLQQQSFPLLMKNLVFDPLGMKSSTFEQPLNTNWQKRAARGIQSGQPVKGGWTIKPEMAAGGLWTTAIDLAKFGIDIQLSLQGKGKLLSQKLTRQMMTLQPNLDSFSTVAKRSFGFEMGFSNGQIYFGHGGYPTGYRSEIIFFENGQGAVILTNSSSQGIIKEIMRGLAVAYNWPSQKPVEKNVISLDSSIVKAYVGKYKFPEGRRPDIAPVTFENGNLYFEGRLLRAETENSFFGPGGETYTFSKNKNGEVTHMVFEAGALKLETIKQ